MEMSNEELFQRLEETECEKEKDEIKNTIVKNNKNMIYYVIKRAGSDFQHLTPDEQEDCGNLALVQAINCYDYKKSAKFSTYYYQVIYRTLLTEVQRKQKRTIREATTFSFEDEVRSEKKGGGEIDFHATIPDERAKGAFQKIEDTIAYQVLMQRAKEILTKRESQVFSEMVAGKRMAQISEEIGISAPRVAQLRNQVRKKLKQEYERGYFHHG